MNLFSAGMWLPRLLTCAMVLALAACGTAQQRAEKNELATSSDKTTDQKRAQIRLQLAIGYFEQRQFDVALDEVKQSLLSDPEFADAYGVRSLIYMEMGENKLAEDNFLRALKIAPNNPDIQSNYGWYLCKNGREAQSIPLFEAALANRNYTSPVKALNNAGLCSLKLKKNKEAEEYFLTAFRVDPGHLPTSLNLARFYFAKPDLERAEFYISRVTKGVPGDQVSADVLWLAAKIYHKVGDVAMETSFGTQLRRYHANSTEYGAYQRGAFNE